MLIQMASVVDVWQVPKDGAKEAAAKLAKLPPRRPKAFYDGAPPSARLTDASGDADAGG